MRKLRLLASLAVCLSMVSVPAFAQTAADAIAWYALAQKLDGGVTLDVRLRDRRHFKAILIDARPDAIVLQRKTRIPVALEAIPYESIAAMSRVDKSSLSRGKVAGIALGSAGAAVGALLLLISLLAYD